MKLLLISLTLILIIALNCINLRADAPTQTVKGTVLNTQTRQPIIGATVVVPNTNFGAYTRSGGEFRMENIPVGRHTLRISAIGYEPQTANIVVTSGRETDVNIFLIEAIIRYEAVEVTGSRAPGKTINEAVMVSGIEFTMDDVQRFAGSRMDPARMAQNYAGVLGGNDTRNDIIIRGGSPTELLWRIDGLDVPNPNHFATQGATGGPVSAINTMMLDNSDFLTGAFPAEYGDKISGVFDLRTRSGNKDKYEYIGQFGFNGFELGAEGPLGFSNSSFMAYYRYSFLGLLDAMGMDFGFSGIPKYQDASFKADMNLSERYKLSITGLWGTSDISIKESQTDNVYTGDFDINNGTDMLALVANLQILYNEKMYGRWTFGTTYANYRTDFDSITTDQTGNVTDLTRWFDLNSSEGYHTGKYSLFYTPSARHFLSFGTEARYRFYTFDGERYTAEADGGSYYPSGVEGNTWQMLSYANWNWRINENLTTNVGLFGQYLELNDKYSIEPRLALSYKLHPLHSLNFGFGVHRQTLPLVIYNGEEGNDKLDFVQSLHYVAGYNYQISHNTFIKLEGYYKDISNAAVDRNKSSAFSLLNAGTNFGSVFGDRLISNGTGKAYGGELSFIRNFAGGYYFTATGSLVRQKYTGSDGIERQGEFDNKYILNMLAGYEWKLSPSFALEFAARYTLAGGAPYTPIDMEKSRQRNATYFLDSEAYTLRKPDYSRFDLRVDIRHNLRKMAIISYLSFENLFNQENVLMYLYDVRNEKVKTVNQLGLFFVGGFRIEF